jgi:hypothetical protein
MKHVKRFLLLALFCLIPLSSALADDVPFIYTIDSGSITITGYIGPGGLVEIPSIIDDHPVTAIDDYAFAFCTGLTVMTIPDSVTSIGLEAFSNCSGLTNVVIGSGVASIGYKAFSDCCGLTNVVIGSGVASIGDCAFSDCYGLTEVVIPNSVTTIGHFVFGGCTGLTNVVIPDSVTSIGDYAFFNCSGLTSINVATANPNYASLGGVLFDKALTTLVQFPGGLAGSYAIPDGVVTIGDYAFYYCTGLTEVVIPDSVTSIGRGAFVECTNMTNVVIGSGVTSIGSYAFSQCIGLQEVYFQGNAPTVGSNVFYGGTGTVYYLAGTTGWGETFGGWPTALYIPPPHIPLEGMGMQPNGNGFGFNISYSGSSSVVVEASTNLLDWTPVSTNILNGGLGNFSDPSSIHYPVRYYRMVIP